MKRLYNPIAIYNYNKRKYFIALDDGKVTFFKYENGEMTDDYSKEELEVFYEVYNSLKVDKNAAVNLGCRRFNGKFFETFYDVKKELYFWYEIIDGNRRNVNKRDLELLNYKYNNQCLVFTEDNEGFGNGHDDSEPFDWETYSYLNLHEDVPENNTQEPYDWSTDPEFSKGEIIDKAKTIKRAITKYGKTIAIIIIAGVNLVTFSDKILHNDAADKLRVFFGGTNASDELNYEENKDIEYNYDIIADKIGNNQNLSQAEKDFFMKFKAYFDDIGPYMELGVVTDRLENLKVEYIPEECKNPDILGEYNPTSNVITIYSADSMENCDISVLAHEFLHVTQKGFSKRLAMELSNEAATAEYLREMVDSGLLDDSIFKNEYDVPVYGTGYTSCMKVYYLLANLLDEEDIKKYQAIPSEILLTNALVKIEENAGKDLYRSFGRYEMEKNALELLDYIDELRTAPDEDGYRSLNYSEEKYQKICDSLDYYYQAKFGKTIDECFRDSINEFDKTFGTISKTTPRGRAIWNVMGKALEENVTDLDDKYKIPMGEYRFVLPRTYFSNKYPNPRIYFNTYQKTSEYSARGFFVGIDVTPEMESEYRSEYIKAQEEISQSENRIDIEKNNDDVGGMGSRDIDRD